MRLSLQWFGVLCLTVGVLSACTITTTTYTPEPEGRPEPVAQNSNSALHSSLNRARSSYGAAPVVEDAALVRAAHNHAVDMASRGFYSHFEPDGGTPMQRMREAGGCRASVSENIAKGWDDDMVVYRGWLGSPAHARNMLGPQYTRYGVASHQGHYVMVLAGPCV